MLEKPPIQSSTPFAVSGPPQISSLAIASLTFALISPIALCVCGLSLLTSLIAIVTGHVALARIKNSVGQLVGGGMAIVGLVVGYLMLGISLVALAIFIPAFQQGWHQGQQNVAQGVRPTSLDANRRLRDAELKVLVSGTDGVATGNSLTARKLAEHFAAYLKLMREVLFTEDGGLVAALNEGKFLTHCELHNGRSAFIVHVPSYRDFDDEAKDTLALLAWKVAQGTVSEELEPGDRLAVGLRGTIVYGAVLIGQVASDDEDEADFAKRERDDLLPFFSPPFADGINAPVPSEPAKPSPPSLNPESPKSLPAIPVPRSPAAQAPKKPRRTAPSPTPGLMDGVPISKDVVQEFPKLGWAVESLAFAPNGGWLAAGKMDRQLLILDVETGSTLSAETKLEELSSVKQVAFSADGQYVAAGGSTGAVSTWRIDADGVLSNAQSLTRHGQHVQSLAINPTTPFLLTGSYDGELIWQSYASETSTSRKQKIFPRNAKAVYLPREGLEALATDGNSLVRVDLKTFKVISTRELPRGSAQAAAFSSDGGKLAITAGYKIQVWDTATGLSLGTLDADHEIQWSVAFLPGGKRLISGGRGFATLWNLETSKAECRFDLGGILYIQTLAISPDGSLLAAIPAAAGQTLTVLRIPE